ncbi:MAG: response regulator transcription factor [Granulosicoccus sp.]
MVAVLSRSGAQITEVQDSIAGLHASPPHNSETANNAVGIVADNTIDGARVARLISFAGIAGIGISRLFICNREQVSDVQAFALVFCHRVNRPDSEFALPDGVKVSRIIVLSDCAREETSVRFLDGGARHFFNIEEPDSILQARLEAGLRQHRTVFLRSFAEGDVHFDVQKRKVTRAGELIDLSPKEFEFACHLFSRLEMVVKNSELMTSVWSLPPDMDTRRIDTAACRVRKKLGLSRDRGWELKRVRRVGYRLSRVESRLEHA